VHEFGTNSAGKGGTTTIPERSWLRSTVDENRKKWQGLIVDLFFDAISGKTSVQKALSKLGVVIQEAVRGQILRGGKPLIPNKPSTAKEKGRNQPLVDSKKLWRSVGYEVNLK
jgi:hypothetical protein